MRAPRAMAVAAAFVVACVASPLAAEGPATLAFDQHGTWHTFWRSDHAPAPRVRPYT